MKDVAGSPLYNVLTQYPDSKPQTNSATFGGSFVDTTPFPASACKVPKGFNVCMVDSRPDRGHQCPGPGQVDTGSKQRVLPLPASRVQNCADTAGTTCSTNIYCAYHSEYELGNQPVIYGNMPQVFSIGDMVIPITRPTTILRPMTRLTSSHTRSLRASPIPTGSRAGTSATMATRSGTSVIRLRPQPSRHRQRFVVLNGHPYRVQQEWSNKVPAAPWTCVG